MIPLLAAEIGPYSNEARFGLFLFVTFVLIGGSWLLVQRMRQYELILLGLVVAAAAMGYSLLGWGVPAGDALPGGVGAFSGTLMKIAVVLVLAGVVRSLLLAWPGDAPLDAPQPPTRSAL